MHAKSAPLQHVHRSLFIHLQTDVRSIAAVERLKDAGDCSLVHLLLELIVAQRGGGSGPARRVQVQHKVGLLLVLLELVQQRYRPLQPVPPELHVPCARVCTLR